jgi:hypothetical protein
MDVFGSGILMEFLGKFSLNAECLSTVIEARGKLSDEKEKLLRVFSSHSDSHAA